RVQAAGGRGAATAQNVTQADHSIDGNPIHIGGRAFAGGVGTRATSTLFIDLGGRAERFTAMVGADDNPLPPPPTSQTSPPGAAAAPSATQPPPPPPQQIIFRIVGDGRV